MTKTKHLSWKQRPSLSSFSFQQLFRPKLSFSSDQVTEALLVALLKNDVKQSNHLGHGFQNLWLIVSWKQNHAKPKTWEADLQQKPAELCWALPPWAGCWRWRSSGPLSSLFQAKTVHTPHNTRGSYWKMGATEIDWEKLETSASMGWVYVMDCSPHDSKWFRALVFTTFSSREETLLKVYRRQESNHLHQSDHHPHEWFHPPTIHETMSSLLQPQASIQKPPQPKKNNQKKTPQTLLQNATPKATPLPTAAAPVTRCARSSSPPHQRPRRSEWQSLPAKRLPASSLA